MGLALKLPVVDHKWVYSAPMRTAICAFRLCQPPASMSPRMGISIAPAQIRTNCSTSLMMADRSPPSIT